MQLGFPHYCLRENENRRFEDIPADIDHRIRLVDRRLSGSARPASCAEPAESRPWPPRRQRRNDAATRSATSA